MAPSPFFAPDGKPKAATPSPISAKPPAQRARAPEPEPEPMEPRRPKAVVPPRERYEDEQRGPRQPARGQKRMIAPIIAGAVLILGVGIAAGIFIAGNGPQVPPQASAPTPAPVAAAVLPPPQPAAVVPPANAALPVQANPGTAAVAGAAPGAAPVAAVPATTPPPAPAAAIAPPPPSPAPTAALPAPQPAAAPAALPPPAPTAAAAPKDEADRPKTKSHKSQPVSVVAADAPPQAAGHGKKAFLVVKTIAGVKVLVDNKQVGVTPLAGPLEVGAGGRFVTLVAPDGRKKGYEVQIDSGDTYNLSESF